MFPLFQFPLLKLGLQFAQYAFLCTFSLLLITHHAMYICVGVEVTAPDISNFTTRWKWASSFMPPPINPREKALDTQWTGIRVGPRACQGALEERILLPLEGIETRLLGRLAKSLVAVLTKQPEG
jgi:hypothetical protein